MTYDSYYNRLAAHDYNWLGDVRGRIFIRLGTIASPTYKADDELERIIEDAERVLIFEMQPPYNSKATQSYTPNHLHRIVNEGYRGKLPSSVSMREHMV